MMHEASCRRDGLHRRCFSYHDTHTFEEEALHAQKIIRDGRELLVISEMDLYQRENETIAGLLRTKKTTIPEVRVYPSPDEAP